MGLFENRLSRGWAGGLEGRLNIGWFWEDVTTATPIKALRRVFIFDSKGRIFRL